MPPKSVSVDKVAIVGTYLPQRCGIATFSSDLRAALSSAAPEAEVQVVAVKEGGHDYPPEVQFEVGRKSLPDYRATVDFLNATRSTWSRSSTSSASSAAARATISSALLQNLRMPVVTTLHTVLEEPDPDQRDDARGHRRSFGPYRRDEQAGAGRSSRRSMAFPGADRGDPPRRARHAVPRSVLSQGALRPRRPKVILTFGLLSRGKGIGICHRGAAAIVADAPRRRSSSSLGETHPGVLAHEGEAYREASRRRPASLASPTT